MRLLGGESGDALGELSGVPEYLARVVEFSDLRVTGSLSPLGGGLLKGVVRLDGADDRSKTLGVELLLASVGQVVQVDGPPDLVRVEGLFLTGGDGNLAVLATDEKSVLDGRLDVGDLPAKIRIDGPLLLSEFNLPLLGDLHALGDARSDRGDALPDGGARLREGFDEARGNLLDLFGLILGEGVGH